MSKKYISFSLWGTSKLYCLGAIENIELAKQFYPDFICRFYVAKNCPALSILQKLDCEVVVMPEINGIDRTKEEEWKWQKEHVAMFWRYFIIDELGEKDVVIFRDCDSRITARESDVVYNWISGQDEIALVIAENASHKNSFAMGGMWGIFGGILTNVVQSIEDWVQYYKQWNHPWIFVDLEYNTNILGPLIGNYTRFVGYGSNNPLPNLKEGERFIGDVYEPQWRGEVFSPSDWVKSRFVGVS
jgi:hypothetical protein